LLLRSSAFSGVIKLASPHNAVNALRDSWNRRLTVLAEPD